MEKGGTPITMRTITKSLFGSPGRSGMSAPALVMFASAIAALVVLALSATAVQSAEHHNGKYYRAERRKDLAEARQRHGCCSLGCRRQSRGDRGGRRTHRQAPVLRLPHSRWQGGQGPARRPDRALRGALLQRQLREGGGETLRDRPGPKCPDRQGSRNGAAHSVAQAGRSRGRESRRRADRAKGRRRQADRPGGQSAE